MNRYPGKRLIIEDDEAVQSVLARGLKKVGHTVQVAACAEVAQELLKQQEYDVLLLDLQLPGKDGLSFLEEIRQQGHQEPVIIITGYADTPSVVKATKLDAWNCLEKPLDLQTVPRDRPPARAPARSPGGALPAGALSAGRFAPRGGGRLPHHPRHRVSSNPQEHRPVVHRAPAHLPRRARQAPPRAARIDRVADRRPSGLPNLPALRAHLPLNHRRLSERVPAGRLGQSGSTPSSPCTEPFLKNSAEPGNNQTHLLRIDPLFQLRLPCCGGMVIQKQKPWAVKDMKG